ncbi:general odorant-binding protein 56a-like [Periplaneta americana]|uniref:general odorant-binding protein 56a-like n=1 Tax=Periplaneta americana TaxID=6978 RepID=UPI0037E94FE9
MKQVLIFTILAIVKSTDVSEEPGPIVQKMKKIFERCAAENGIISGDELMFLKMDTPPLTTQAKCFMGCYLEGMGLIKDGKFTEENCLSWAGNAKLAIETGQELWDKCRSRVGDGNDRCETGSNLWMCIRSLTKKKKN